MKFTLGFAAGVAVAWTALAIWQRTPPLGPIDPADASDGVVGELFEPFWAPPPSLYDFGPDYDGVR